MFKNELVVLSDSITNVANLTFYQNAKKAYKTGYVVTLTICAYNGTGSDIAANTTLLTLGSGLTPIDDLVVPVNFDGQWHYCLIARNGNISLDAALESGTTHGFSLSISYATNN